jgi:hypothetical protein
MHRRFLRLLPLFVAALWLPFQAIAATAMPFCRHGEAHKLVALADDATVDHCATHVPQQPAPDHGKSCDDCGFCHLAAAGMMPTPERVAAVVPVARDFRTDAPQAPASIIPEPPQQPPKRVA